MTYHVTIGNQQGKEIGHFKTQAFSQLQAIRNVMQGEGLIYIERYRLLQWVAEKIV